MATVNCSRLICVSADDAARCKFNRNVTAAHSSSSGSALSQQKKKKKKTIHPSIPLFQYTYRHALPPSLLSHNTQKRGENQSPHKKSRWEYIIWVRNNLFWPSPACALKWSPWVAAYQRAAAIEWVVGITQPGFRTYTGHSKGRAHWAREIHSEADCARSCFDWGWIITNPPRFMMALSWELLYILWSMHLCKGGGGACNLLSTSNCISCLQNCYYHKQQHWDMTMSDSKLDFEELNKFEIFILIMWGIGYTFCKI